MTEQPLPTGPDDGALDIVDLDAPPPPVLVGLGGLKTSGKDTVADFLAADVGFVKVGMSEPLHTALLTLNPQVEIQNRDMSAMTPEESAALRAHPLTRRGRILRYADIHAALGYDRMKTLPEVRRLQQVFGTDVARNMISETVWIDAAEQTIDAHLSAGSSVALTGVRFVNEQKLVRGFGGWTVWVERPGLRQAQQPDRHPSEASLTHDSFDYVIENDGDLGDLHRKTVALAMALNGPRA